jgi:cytochrome c oxidase cbb3-type subunit 3
MIATGAPNLTDKIWLYGGDIKTLTETISKGRNKNVMPAWGKLLGPERIHVVAAYVWQLNRGDDGKVRNPEK